MQILTEKNVLGMDTHHPDAAHFTVLRFQDGLSSYFPKGLFRNNHDEDVADAPWGRFFIGRDSILGVGSIAKYDGNQQSLVIGRHVRGGLRLRFLLNGQHETRTMGMSMFGGGQVRIAPPPQHGDTVLRNDIWIGDEVLVLGGVTIENGCVIGARSVVQAGMHTEPYGIYQGNPARLMGFRFGEALREALIELAWWDQPFDFVRQHNDDFVLDFAADEELALERIKALQQRKNAA